jgi:hypothetical protein
LESKFKYASRGEEMLKMKRNFALLILGMLLSALTAGAQVFSLSSQGNLTLRQEGLDEKVAALLMTATTGGTISVVPAPTSIELVFGATIGNATAISAADATSNTYVSCTIASLALSSAPCGAANFTISAAGNAVSITAKKAITIAVGDSILVRNVRVNATTLAAGATVNVNANTLPAAPPTYTGNPQIVATNAGSKALLVGLSPTPGFISPLPGPLSVLTCSPPVIAPPLAFGDVFAPPVIEPFETFPSIDFIVNVAKQYNSALSTMAEEAPDGLNDTQIQIVIINVPPTTTVTPVGAVSCPNTPTATCMLRVAPFVSGVVVAFGAPGALTTGSTQGSLTFTFDVGTTNQAAPEDVDIYFNVQFTGTGTLPINEMTPAVATFSLAPTSSSAIPFFSGVAEPYNSLGGNVMVIGDCVTDLLFPWASNFHATPASTASNANFSTAIVVANTTLDTFTTAKGGAVPQSAGSCTFTFFPNDLTTPGVLTTTPVPAGSEVVIDIGAAFPSAFTPSVAGKSGYIIATCGFQNAHAYVNIYDNASIGPPVTVQTYLGLVIPNPQVHPRNPAGGPGTPGEQLVH